MTNKYTVQADMSLPQMRPWISSPFTLVLAYTFCASAVAADTDVSAGGTKWATAEQEAQDERRDAELFKAIVESVTQWQKRQNQRRRKRSDSSVCYPLVGCFGVAGYIDMLPAHPDEVNTRFLLYNSRKSRGDTPLLDVKAQNMSAIWDWAGKAFNVSAPTKVIIHGFGSSCSNVWVYEMRSALMSVEDCNIICVDWEPGATIPNYVRAAANTRLVGKQVAMLISGLEKRVRLPVHNVHMIGFSLGAHVAGYAGSELKNLSRITGLDPAGPLFESQDKRARLDSNDAEFVDVIHSNGENLILGGLGAWQTMGHVDFYPNGGRMQKGCTNLFVGAVSDMIWSANEVYGRSLCNHRRAYKFFTDSVSARCQFPAVPCESYDAYLEGKCFPCREPSKCGNMGYYANKHPGRGTLYLLTRDEEPFCAHQYMVKIESSRNESKEDKAMSYGKIQIMLIGDLELNETFTITQKRDEKLISGSSISRIIVPHPALQNFFKIQLLYTAYSGWLSSGLTRWNIDKVSLINSYGQVLSVCKKNHPLESGIPTVLPLYERDCTTDDIIPISDTNDISAANNTTKKKLPWTEVIQLGDEILPNKTVLNYTTVDEIDETIGIGVTEYYNYLWNPLGYQETGSYSGNNLDNSKTEWDIESRALSKSRAFVPLKRNSSKRNDSRVNSFDNSTENRLLIAESVTKSYPPTPARVNETLRIERENSGENDKFVLIDGYHPYNFVTDRPLNTSALKYNTVRPEIKEPVLKPKNLSSRLRETARAQNSKSIDVEKAHNISIETTTRRESWFFWAPNNNKKSDNVTDRSYESRNNTDSEKSFVAQLLPQRLVSFLEQAEKYAKLALSPFMSDTKSKNDRTRRKLMDEVLDIVEEDHYDNFKSINRELEESQSSVVPYPFEIPNLPAKRHEYKYIPLQKNHENVEALKRIKLAENMPNLQTFKTDESLFESDRY